MSRFFRWRPIRKKYEALTITTQFRCERVDCQVLDLKYEIVEGKEEEQKG
ncbi:12536_t:CDS:2 [Cetraspora pellucida]|uniref:12536_t:CDS:1 n=1 Tax=Cetraspora pellucida TaxID=1433469 RepID=A0A9N9FJM1_9GLOM|nr:12536_t:CDS:2 [Cetraspora pellucida]